MSTHSTITVKIRSKVKTIFCHFDGYLRHNEAILLKHYNNQELAETVVSLGDLLTLGETMGCAPEHYSHDFINKYSEAFERDTTEENTDARIYSTYEAAMVHSPQEYNYYWDGEKWFVDGKALIEECFLNNV